MKKNPKIEDWLSAKRATPCEAKIYRIIMRVTRGEKSPVKNSDICERYVSAESKETTCRTNITIHLRNMVKKGILKKYSVKFYTPVMA